MMKYRFFNSLLFVFTGLLLFSTCEDKDVDNIDQNIVSENKLTLKWIGRSDGGNCYDHLYYVVNPNDTSKCHPSVSFDCDEIILHLDVKMGTNNDLNLLTYTLKSNPLVYSSIQIYLPNCQWEELDN